MESDKQIVLVAQKKPSEDNPSFQISTRWVPCHHPANAQTSRRHPQGSGGRHQRVELISPVRARPFCRHSVRNLPWRTGCQRSRCPDRHYHLLFEQYVNLSKKIPAEVITTVSGIEDANRLADTIASHMTLSLEQKQDVLEIADLY